jgi:hypothetical protein
VTDSPALDTYRWTLAEYVLRCEDSGNLTEVVVEGDLDRDVIEDALQRWGVTGATVIDMRDIGVTDEELASVGLGSGTRERLVAAALALEQRATESDVAGAVAFIADRDYEPPTTESRYLYVTDGYSIESYALNEATFDRFVRVVLGRARSSGGTGGGLGRRVHLCSGAELLERVLRPSIELAGIRLALKALQPSLAPSEKWTKDVNTDGDGIMTLRSAQVIERALQKGKQQDEGAAVELQRNAAAAKARADPFRLVRGHDYVAALHKLLQTTWGRRIGGTNVKAWSEDRIARMLLVAALPDLLDQTQLFLALRDWLAG